jgi:hypothetical protein
VTNGKAEQQQLPGSATEACNRHFFMIGQSQQIRGEFQYMPTATPNTITKAPTTPAFHNDVRSFTSYAKIKYCSHQNRKEA